MIAGAASRSAMVSNSGATRIIERGAPPPETRPACFKSTNGSRMSETLDALDMMYEPIAWAPNLEMASAAASMMPSSLRASGE
jgi:hypothetical protein